MGFWRRSVESLVVTPASPDPAFWRGRQVLVTGHTGFKGAWLCYWLTRMGAVVVGLALPPNTDPNLFSEVLIGSRVESLIVDIRDLDATRSAIVGARPEIVFHLAAQPLVLRSYKAPIETFSTNVLGTAHVLESLRELPEAKVAVMITTDKVYANREWVYPYREEDPLGGHDPYSASKAACEIVISSYRSSFLREQGVAVASARAGNVIGGGDWSADRLIPDIARAWERGDSVRIRRPDSVRPWQHVLEPLCGYLVLAERLAADSNLADAYNFGPEGQDFAAVRSVLECARRTYPDARGEFDANPSTPHEAGLLSLEIAKAKAALGVAPRWGLGEAIKRTMEWYRSFYAGEAGSALCEGDIKAFLGEA
jgi:CDP-glucose 4,6-dehydratase